MREIKFRAWDIPGKLMVYSGRQETQDLDGGERTYWTYITPGSVEKTCLEITLLDTGGLEKEVIYGHLMQYTGLKDKNGTEIYEGDLVQIQYGRHKTLHIGEVQWLSDVEGVGWNLVDDVNTHYEVIGNIYENKELVK